ncbi:MAG: chemotaxis protein CheW [Phenylobacterium sp.]|nr:chemotaxis protein CheW [Phenylobacterium sp.]
MSERKPRPSRTAAARSRAVAESPLTRQILDERERRLAAVQTPETPEERSPSISVLLCPLGGNLYGVPMNEVASLRPLERLGRTGATTAGAVMGLVADSGRVRQVLDLGALLGAPPPRETDGYLILLKGRRDVALRLPERPHAGEARPDLDRPQHASVVSSGDHHAKTLVILSVAALLAGGAPVGA